MTVHKIAVLPGDGIGQEVTPEAQKILQVVGKATGDIKVLNDIVRRNRASAGTMFLPNSSWLQTALYPADVLRAARGFYYQSLDSVRARG